MNIGTQKGYHVHINYQKELIVKIEMYNKNSLAQLTTYICIKGYIRVLKIVVQVPLPRHTEHQIICPGN